MVSIQSVHAQLEGLRFNYKSWGKTEVSELHRILIPDEQIYECVNGIYEGGFALLVATNVRVLLVDKKPLNYLTVEDLRFDMINELDYSHRLFGAEISISAGNKNLKFRSYNQGRLRKLINHVQHIIAELKKQQSQHQEGQNLHLEQINQQLEAYLMAQFQAQQKMNQQSQLPQTIDTSPTGFSASQLSPELKDYLIAQNRLIQSQEPKPYPEVSYQKIDSLPNQQELYAEGQKEIFSKHPQVSPASGAVLGYSPPKGIEVNALRIAYSKLPMVLRNRKFGRHIGFVKAPVSPEV